MKTQISHLINMSPFCIRANHTKWEGVTGGTPHDERMGIAKKVCEEHPGNLSLTIKGVTLTLNRHDSVSGKTTYWSTDLEPELFRTILNLDCICSKKNKQEAITFVLQPDMTIEIQVYWRNNARCMWRHHWTHILDEAFVTIL